jgi:hypothetical protein
MSKEKDRVRKMVSRAIKSGKIKKADNCEHCGLEVPRDKPHELQAHHEDYSRPLEVEWLCYGCHSLRDRMRQLTSFLSMQEGLAGDLRRMFDRDLRIATGQLKKREWLNGIPVKDKE